MGMGLLERAALYGGGPGPWAALIWLPLLVIGPLSHVPEDLPTWLAWLAVAAVALLHIGAVCAVHGPRRVRVHRPELLVGLQAVLTFGLVLAYGLSWMPLVQLLAIGVGAAVRPRLAPVAVAGVTVAAMAALATTDATWDDAWTTVLVVFLSGFVTYLFYRLMAVIGELQRTRQDLAGAAVERERERFARDLHDLLGHTMSLIVVKAEAVRRLVDRDPAAAQSHAQDIERIGREALVEVRRAVAGYRGLSLQEELVRARSTLVSAGITAEVGPAPVLAEEIDAVLGWVVREGVTNVVRHARASHCSIVVSVATGRVRLEIDDDGVGVGVASAADADSTGLIGLRARVTAAGGWLETSPGAGGFRLVADLPAPSLVGLM